MTTKQQRKYPRVYAKNTKPSMTKQSFKDEVNINKIMDKFQKSGALTHYAKHAPTYGDATQVDLHEAIRIVAEADEMFDELPSSIRKRFSNDPEEFLEFVQDPKNLEEMRKMGLAEPNAPPAERPAKPETKDKNRKPDPAPASAPAAEAEGPGAEHPGD